MNLPFEAAEFKAGGMSTLCELSILHVWYIGHENAVYEYKYILDFVDI